MEGFIARNDKRLIIVSNWSEFVEWAEEAGYDESYFDVNDSKCYALQHLYLEEVDE